MDKTTVPPTATSRLDEVTARFARSVDVDRIAARIGATITSARETKPSGTMRSWFESHNGQKVTTVQVGIERGNIWAPMHRTIDTSRAGSVRFNDSIRDYKGMRVLHSTPECLIVTNNWHVIAYVIEEVTA